MSHISFNDALTEKAGLLTGSSLTSIREYPVRPQNVYLRHVRLLIDPWCWSPEYFSGKRTNKKVNFTHFQFDRWLSNEVTIQNHRAIVSRDNCGRNILNDYFRNLQSIILDTHQFREPHLATHREHSPSQLQQHCKRRTSWPSTQPYQCVPYFQNVKQFYGAGVQAIPFMPTIKVHDLAVIDFVETSTCSAALCTPI